MDFVVPNERKIVNNKQFQTSGTNGSLSLGFFPIKKKLTVI
jgi:hypothetical protein